jgi:hypothetical protein
MGLLQQYFELVQAVFGKIQPDSKFIPGRSNSMVCQFLHLRIYLGQLKGHKKAPYKIQAT